MNHNDYIFSCRDGEFRLTRQFEQMYRSCEDPHGQSSELEHLDYQIVILSLRHMLKLLPPGASRSLLDVGCGLGYFTGYLHDQLQGWSVTGADISPTALAKAAQRHPGCRFLPLDIKDDTNLPSELYDVIMAMNVLYYFTEKEIHGVLVNLKRLARPGALMVVGYHLPETVNFGRFIHSLEDARALIEPFGFSYRLGLDFNNQVDLTYASAPVGRHLYFAFQNAGDASHAQ